MLRQYAKIKGEYPDAILMFRLGDFYEMFYEDAKIAAKILDITLTSRNRNDPNPVPLCGVPFHSVEPYIAKLVESGRRVAICDQVEDPALAKGIVKREITRVVTPGVVPDGLALPAKRHNFLAALSFGAAGIGFAIADASTGFFEAGIFSDKDSLVEELLRRGPREILVSGEEQCSPIIEWVRGKFTDILISDSSKNADGVAHLEKILGRDKPDFPPQSLDAAASLLSYVSQMQKGRLAQFSSLELHCHGSGMRLDESTIRNLELVSSMRDGERLGSLLDVIDKTSTAVGARKLRDWLLYPLTDVTKIEMRLGAVSEILASGKILREVPALLSRMYDLERLTGKIGSGTVNARDLVALMNSFKAVSSLKSFLEGSSGYLGECASMLDPCDDIASRIENTIAEDPPFSIREGGFIRKGCNRELDELRDIIAHGKDYIAGIENSEREKTGISSLKIRFNKVFGYYIEITNAHRDRVPLSYIRKQTLANAERYITPELKEYEEKVLGAEEKTKALEHLIFSELRESLIPEIVRIQRTADAAGAVDVLVSFARLAAEMNYARPKISDSGVIEIKGGRHPVVEALSSAERFVPNDLSMDERSGRFMMITGPNMAGKSTVMRQTALIVLMAQIGSFVPATSAEIGVVDRIFTRVGASDALSRGQSTFMLEMSEAAMILKEATDRSLIIIDEIGRGTSTFDGLAIAWAIAEDIHDRIRARTMFATHYHELTDLASTRPGIRNMQIAIKEWQGGIVFLRKLIPGGTSRSYGIEVAKLAGLSSGLITRASEILKNLEEGEFDDRGIPRIAGHLEEYASDQSQFNLFTAPQNSEITERLGTIDTSRITPIEALNILHELKQKI